MISPATMQNSQRIKAACLTELNRRKAGRELARRHFDDFIRHFPPGKPYHFGRHTQAMCSGLERAAYALEAGVSSYLIYICPPRHGKSDLVSRRFAPWIMGRMKEVETILATYGAALSIELSRDARRCVASPEYERTFGLKLSTESHAGAQWQLAGHRGKVHAVGLDGSITGHGAEVLLIDDYCKSRAEADSDVVRDGIWSCFRSDLMTRLAPAHIVVIVATRWHEDDLVGRIIEAMAGDPDFPRFELQVFPALGEGPGGESQWLFPERFSDSWYLAERALVGSHGWQALFQGDPQPREGNLLQTAAVQIVDTMPEDVAWVRYWDLASSKKERTKDNPDFTAGGKVGVRLGDNCVPHVYIADMIRGQWEAPERDRTIRATATRDGTPCVVGVEVVAGYKDAGVYIRQALGGKYVVQTNTPNKDKVIRATPLEPIFEAGHVYLKRAAWNDAFLAECAAFPKGKKDDQVDAISGAFEIAMRRLRSFRVETL